MVPTDSFDRETGIDMLNVNGGISDGAQYAIRKLLWALIIAVVLEIAWFNFPFWESLTFGTEQQVELNTRWRLVLPCIYKETCCMFKDIMIIYNFFIKTLFQI